MSNPFALSLIGALSPAGYVRSVGLDPFAWQEEALDPGIRRMILLTARQSGKSTVVAGKAIQKARFHPGSLTLIICPAQDQSKELMKKVETFMMHDKDLPEMKHDATFEKEFINGSRIVALPGSERSVRGYSGPSMIIIDEASRVLDETYRALRPMMTGADTELVLMSTPYGKRGFFYNEWTHGQNWRKILVKPAYTFSTDLDLIPDVDEKTYRKQNPGLSTYYSPRHTFEFLQDELYSMGEYWFRQEYLCEFVETEEQLFKLSMIEQAMADVDLLYTDDVYSEVEMLEV